MPTSTITETNSVSEHAPAQTNGASTEYKSQWKTTSPVPLTRESFLNLLAGKTPVIQMPHWVSDETCQKVTSHLMPRFTPYLHATGPSVDKVGLAQFEFQAQSEEDLKNRTGNGKAPIDTPHITLPFFFF